jgi:hypothetical protein
MDRPRSHAPEPCPDAAPSPGWFTYARNGDRWSRPLGGPYDDLDLAKSDIDRIRSATESADPWAHFYTFVSVHLQTPPATPPVFGTMSTAAPTSASAA